MAAVFSPDGARVATTCWDRVARIWDAGSGQLVGTLGGSATQLLDVGWSPDGRLLATSGHDGEVFIWDVETGRRERTLEGHSGAVTTASMDGFARVWDAHRDTRPAAEIEEFVARRIPWRLVDGRIEVHR
jgi:WD40 repeat protein